MKKQLILTCICILFSFVSGKGQSTKTATIYIDSKGVMRWSDTRHEASFFGVNYTPPFAHAYRAIGYLGLDHKAAIDKDVYHFARLGFNAYRVHLWDVELTDGKGNLLGNEHLDLLDYLIAKLKERNIHIVITAQTNFGNGYPERNIPTGGFSYKYDKCNMHANPEAIAAQETYLRQLVQHTNPYTGSAYKDDPAIIGFEVNNEPCHSGTKEEVKAYINRMLKALHDAGNRKPVFYNVSHNEYVVDAYYETAVQGTTYQWYPIGLVSGQTQEGNFLPYVDRYDIPFANVKGFNTKARMVYEFDPADIMYSYMYPAMVRTFRTAGFQWITQFAYDPIDIAYANTEYQTHFLNLAYTPHKAISMKIAAEAAQVLKRGESYGSYPQDTLFGNGFRVSYNDDLSEWNNGTKFYYSNSTRTQPKDASRLESVAGCGHSPVVSYEGTGAYFIDRLESGVWRLEVMPDAVVVNDPFAKPSLQKEVVAIAHGSWDLTLRLPDLGTTFSVLAIDRDNQRAEGVSTNGTIAALRPGVYLLKRQGVNPVHAWSSDSSWGNIRIGEYVAPVARSNSYKVTHKPAATVEAGQPFVINAEVVGPSIPDSVIIYTDKISFWNEHNPYIKMKRMSGYRYQATVPAAEMVEGCFRYNIIVCRGDSIRTYPGVTGECSAGISGNPLDWNFTSTRYWETQAVAPGSVIGLLTVTDSYSHTEAYTLPEWSSIQRTLLDASPVEKPLLRFSFTSKQSNPVYFLRTLVKSTVAERKEKLKSCTTLCIRINPHKAIPLDFRAGFISSDGYTYKAVSTSIPADGIIRIPLKELQQTRTALLPVPYPTFLQQYFTPSTDIPFSIEKIEKLEISFSATPEEIDNRKPVEIELGNVWLE
ncbi:membrane protein [Bacteroides reticulotermitis]|uniref:Glycoside hydrolase family 5 domain-containing protein n=2 Tax=Bacteroides reticulotermitis TaxID=1133319 RepID=W4UQ70_9BACE|nr:membrane protein [Bacteroides reticulotermitis]MBB4042884.1 hypothetical protein [Bacteroides reticulotermitis]GAE83111.1 hypothetical protein JCM10512_1365 [Bacteroides reticulotermitis JCM 10512]